MIKMPIVMGRLSVNYTNTKCTAATAPFKLYNVGGAVAGRVYSYEDNNEIWLNSTLLGVFNKQEGVTFNMSPGDILKSCYPIASSGEEGVAGITLLDKNFMSNRLGTNASRYGGIDLNIYSIDATTVNIYRNHVLFSTVTLTPGQLTIFTQAGNPYTGSWILEADGCIIAYKREDNQGNGDPSPVVPISNDIIGWASTAAYISSEIGGTTFNSYSNMGNYNGSIATTYNIVNSADLPHNGSQDNYYDPLVSLRVIGQDGLYGLSRADSDGGCNTAFFPVSLMRKKHLIPQPTEFISISNLTGANIDIYDENGILTTVTPTKINTDVNAPYSYRLGVPNNSQNFNAGYLIECIDPLMVVYQPKGGGAFASDDDELNSIGIN